jgi:hypothetical protein
MTPYQMTYNEVPDISAYLNFHWWEPVRYSANSTSLDQTNERAGRFVGVADTVGDALTYWILDEETHRVVARSIVTARKDDLNPNLRLGMPDVNATSEGHMFVRTEEGEEEEFNLNLLSTGEQGELLDDEEAAIDVFQPETQPEFYLGDQPFMEQQSYERPPSARPQAYPNTPNTTLPAYSPDELINKTFIYELPDGKQARAEVVRKLQTIEAANRQNIQFLCKVGNEEEGGIID